MLSALITRSVYQALQIAASAMPALAAGTVNSPGQFGFDDIVYDEVHRHIVDSVKHKSTDALKSFLETIAPIAPYASGQLLLSAILSGGADDAVIKTLLDSGKLDPNAPDILQSYSNSVNVVLVGSVFKGLLLNPTANGELSDAHWAFMKHPSVNVNTSDDGRSTPLIDAIYAIMRPTIGLSNDIAIPYYQSIVKAFVEIPAVDLTITNSDGDTAAEVAHKLGLFGLEKYINEAAEIKVKLARATKDANEFKKEALKMEASIANIPKSESPSVIVEKLKAIRHKMDSLDKALAKSRQVSFSDLLPLQKLFKVFQQETNDLASGNRVAQVTGWEAGGKQAQREL